MFTDPDLIRHLDEKSTISVDAGCFIEINQNDFLNVETMGVFKYGSPFGSHGNILKYSDIRSWGPNPETYRESDQIPTAVQRLSHNIDSQHYLGKIRKSDFFNLADCFTQFRPRSGINKLVQPMTDGTSYIDDFRSVNRPRYYLCSLRDTFKYWTSWNTDVGPFIGVSSANGSINEAAPFVVYKEPVAINKICIKIQTGMGEPYPTVKSLSGSKDPLTNIQNSTIPSVWRIEYLDVHNTWQTAMKFDSYNKEVFDTVGGTFDIVYKLLNPQPGLYKDSFVFKQHFDHEQQLPLRGIFGEAFIVGRNHSSLGRLFVWNNFDWIEYDVEYGWTLIDPTANPEDYATKDFIDPRVTNPTMNEDRTGGDSNDIYSDIVFCRGLRIIVDQMVAPNKPFELIEMSPRLFANVSDFVISYDVNKAVSDKDSILPIGGIHVSNGNVVLANMDLILNREMKYDIATRRGSILANRVKTNTKFLFYEIVRDVNVSGVHYDKFIPVKTLYAVREPTTLNGMEDVSVELRDLNFRFEEEKAPNIILKECSLTKAVATLLDYIGFTNYIFHMGSKKTYENDLSPLETIIPYFYASETQSIAEVLDALAVATQCAMFFDEYNNFVVMPREHFGTSPVYTFRGNNDGETYPNIEEMSLSTSVISDAEIKYTHRDLARIHRNFSILESGGNSTMDVSEAGNSLIYSPKKIWDVTQLESQTLSAGPLNSPLSADIPRYSPNVTGSIANNTFDLGAWADYFPFTGMIAMNGEIIEFDAKQYNIDGKLVWIESQEHLNERIGRSPFKRSDGSNQLSYPTGLFKIKADLEQLDNGRMEIVDHGRGKFGSQITNHSVDPVDWTQSPTYRFVDTALGHLYGVQTFEGFTFGRHINPAFNTSVSGHNSTSNYIYNSLHSQNSILSQSPMNIAPQSVSTLSAQRRVMRSSALTFGGTGSNANEVFVKAKVLPGGHYRFFGARIGIIGTDKGLTDGIDQTAMGDMALATYKMNEDEPEKTIIGAGGGITFINNRVDAYGNVTSNDGYYYEILALNTSYNVTSDDDLEEVVFANVNFYKMNRAVKDGVYYNVPVKLFSTYTEIVVTSGSQMKRDRIIPGQNMVYDLAVEVKPIGAGSGYARAFHLYLNDALLGIVEETDSGTGYMPYWGVDPGHNTTIGLFVRGGSQIQAEHIYALGTVGIEPNPIFSDYKMLDRPNPFKIFSPSLMYVNTALAGGRSSDAIYFEEFGTIAREVKRVIAEFDMYPAFISHVAKDIVYDRSYSISGYHSDPFRAEFMLWSQADGLINIGSEETNIGILGLVFQDNKEATVYLDDLYSGKYSDSPQVPNRESLKKNVLFYRSSGITEKINFSSPYIQSRIYALKMLSWLSGFAAKEFIEIELSAFGVPHIQIGDIVTIDYDIPNLVESVRRQKDIVSPLGDNFETPTIAFLNNGDRFMVKSISVNRDVNGPEYKLNLAQLPDIATWNAGDF